MESELHEQNYSMHLSSFFFVRSISLTGFWMTRKRSFQKLESNRKRWRDVTECGGRVNYLSWAQFIFGTSPVNSELDLYFCTAHFPVPQPSHTRALSMIAALSCVRNKASTSGKKHKRTARTAAVLQTYLLFSTMFPSFKSLCTIFFCKIHNSITWAKAQLSKFDA